MRNKVTLVSRGDLPGKPCQAGPGYHWFRCIQSTLDICNYERFRHSKHKLLLCQWIRAFVLLAIVLLILKIMQRTLHRNQYY